METMSPEICGPCPLRGKLCEVADKLRTPAAAARAKQTALLAMQTAASRALDDIRQENAKWLSSPPPYEEIQALLELGITEPFVNVLDRLEAHRLKFNTVVDLYAGLHTAPGEAEVEMLNADLEYADGVANSLPYGCKEGPQEGKGGEIKCGSDRRWQRMARTALDKLLKRNPE